MKQRIKGVLYGITAVVLCAVFFMSGNQLFLFAEEEHTPTYTKDPEPAPQMQQDMVDTDEQEPVTSNLDMHSEENNAQAKENATPYNGGCIITLYVHDEQFQPVGDFGIYVDGILSHYTTDGSGRLQLNMEGTSAVVIEPYTVAEYEYSPPFINVDPNQLQGEYEFERRTLKQEAQDDLVTFAFPGVDPAKQEEFIRNSMAEFVSGETARIELNASPSATLFYGINETIGSMEVENYVPYQGVIELTKRDDFEITKVCAFAQMELDTPIEESKKYCIQVRFTQAQADEEQPNNEELEYRDEDGNTYAYDDIEVKIEEAQEKGTLQELVKEVGAFKEIKPEHFTFLDVAWQVKDSAIRVTPDGAYALVIPYPNGADAQHDFVVYGFQGDQAAQLTYTKASDGIHISLQEAATLVIGWKEATTDIENEDLTQPSKEEDGTHYPGLAGGVNTGGEQNTSLYIIGNILLVSILYCMSGQLKQRRKS